MRNFVGDFTTDENSGESPDVGHEVPHLVVHGMLRCSGENTGDARPDCHESDCGAGAIPAIAGAALLVYGASIHGILATS